MRFGLIGGSKGNGHPYSWSAILNGYDSKVMAECPYPAIPKYLEKKNSRDFIKTAKVTSIWTQDIALSQHIAKATYINNILDDYRDMANSVDGVIIARDDYLFAHELALFFLKKGMPVYLDKPGAIYLESAKTLLNTRLNDWQLFTCSPNKYALEFDFKAYSNQIRQKRTPVKIRGVVPNSWEKYIIHVISPLHPCLAALGEPVRFKSIKTTSGIVANYCYENESSLYLEATGKNDVIITISFFINGKEVVHQMEDPFDAFKLSLLAFIDMVEFKKNWFDDVEFLRTVKYIESGIR